MAAYYSPLSLRGRDRVPRGLLVSSTLTLTLSLKGEGIYRRTGAGFKIRDIATTDSAAISSLLSPSGVE
jgi:hypothetical protein